VGRRETGQRPRPPASLRWSSSDGPTPQRTGPPSSLPWWERRSAGQWVIGCSESVEAMMAEKATP
jgi:hypothetical protein